MARTPKPAGQRQPIPDMDMSSAEIYALAELQALKDAVVLLFGAFMSEWPDEKFEQFSAALQSPRPHALEGLVPPELSGVITDQFESSRSRLATRLGYQRAMLIEALAQHLDS